MGSIHELLKWDVMEMIIAILPNMQSTTALETTRKRCGAVATAMHFLISAVGTEEGKEIDGARNGFSP